MQMALELQFFLKHYKKSPNLQFFKNFSSFGSSPDPLQQNPGSMITQASDPPFYGMLFVPSKIPFQKF